MQNVLLSITLLRLTRIFGSIQWKSSKRSKVITKSDISWFNRGCECFEAIVWIVFAKMNVLFLQLLLLSSFLSTNVAKKSKSKSRKKNERASLLGLTDEYSTFELPFKYSPNLIKIGNTKYEFYKTFNIFIFKKAFPCQNCSESNLRNFFTIWYYINETVHHHQPANHHHPCHYQVHFLYLIFDLTINLINKMAMMNGKYSCDDQFLPRGKAVS